MNTRSVYAADYHSLLRPEIASLIPTNATKILDLGCGSGRLGSFIKNRQKCTYHGIEINETAANLAKKSLDRVYCYDLEAHPATHKGLNYDTLIFADILEHLSNPWSVLDHFTKEMHESGTIIASIPNIAHPSVSAELANGLFRYTPAGILDRTHLRFWTLTTIFQMFTQLNLKITKISPSPSADNPIQWLITAKRSAYYNKPINTTIIIPTHNKFNYLEQTIKSIRTNTKQKYRIIVVNNNSALSVSDWLETQDDILEIRCTKNLGFTITTNLGMAISDSAYTILMNNDILVTRDWLTRLIKCAERDRKIGIVGPMTNKVSGKQRHLNAKYNSLDELSAFASTVTKEAPDYEYDHPRIVFFCTLIKKEVIDKIGLLDERFSPGNYEDDDYCLRSLEAGFRNMIDRYTFVHHYGSQSWNNSPTEYKALLARNRDYFFSKWGTKAESFLERSSK